MILHDNSIPQFGFIGRLYFIHRVTQYNSTLILKDCFTCCNLCNKIKINNRVSRESEPKNHLNSNQRRGPGMGGSLLSR